MKIGTSTIAVMFLLNTGFSQSMRLEEPTKQASPLKSENWDPNVTLTEKQKKLIDEQKKRMLEMRAKIDKKKESIRELPKNFNKEYRHYPKLKDGFERGPQNNSAKFEEMLRKQREEFERRLEIRRQRDRIKTYPGPKEPEKEIVPHFHK